MTLRLENVQIDVPPAGYDRAVEFWAAAVGGAPRAGNGPYTHLVGARSPLGIHLQRLGHGDGRVHLDLRADDPDTEVGRLVGLGATVRDEGSQPWTVLTDPVGTVLCVVPDRAA